MKPMEGDKGFDAKAGRRAANQPGHRVLPFSLPQRGAPTSPSQTKALSPTLVRSHPRCRQEPTGRRAAQAGRGEPGGLGRADSAAGADWDEGDEPKGRPCWGKAAVLGCEGGRRLRSWEKANGSFQGAPEHPGMPPGVSPTFLPVSRGCRQQPQALRNVTSPLSQRGKGPLIAGSAFICFNCCTIRA